MWTKKEKNKIAMKRKQKRNKYTKIVNSDLNYVIWIFVGSLSFGRVDHFYV